MKVGSASPTNGPGSGFGYDSAGRLSLIAHVDGTGYIASYGYTYDAGLTHHADQQPGRRRNQLHLEPIRKPVSA